MPMSIPMCEEMKKLREMLTERGIEWKDVSSIEHGIDKYHADSTIYRTHFETGGFKYSVIYGYGTYGGYDPFNGDNPGLLECMTSELNDGCPVGYMTAQDVINVIDGKYCIGCL